MRTYFHCTHFRSTVAASATLLLLAGCGGNWKDELKEKLSDKNVPTLAADRLLATTDTGQIRGVTRSTAGADAEVFLGIPYAAPPTGSLRWAAPARPPAWQGVRDGGVAPPVCPQGTTGNEDCLYLNIYRPAGTRADAALPVMVYAHGGGNVGGSANGFNATRMASDNGMIVVIPNYRLGALGFLNHPALGPVSQGGNYGVLDTRAALEWVQRNIAAFGGSPKNVTLSSQSSGSTNTCRLLVDPSTAGLLHAAVLSSEDCIHDVDPPADAVLRATNLANKVGCTDAATVATCLRSKTAAELVAAGSQGPQGSGWNPTAAKSAADAIAAREWRPVPILLGSTREEGRSAGTAFTRFTSQDYAVWITRLVGAANTPAVLANYPANKYTGQYAIPYVVGDLITDSGMRGLGGCPNVALAKTLATQTPTYLYQFEDPNPPTNLSTPAGYDNLASHGFDVAYGFPSDAVNDVTTRFTAGQRQLSNEMIRYWGAFAKNHNPAVAGQAAWPRFSGPSGQLLSLRPASASQATPLADFERQHQCAFWATMPLILDRGEL